LINTIEYAAKIIEKSTAILIGAGAGMGVDSGLPDFRGDEGFWRAYPPMKKLGLSFYDLANPIWFVNDPERAWGFYGHRRNLYNGTEPHEGFEILRQLSDSKPGGGFVFTSNVDGHFQKSGFSKQQVVECHGSINFEQCVRPCELDIWEMDRREIEVDLDSFRANGEIPKCNQCGETARPNVLMFGDSHWVESRTEQQYVNYEAWLNENASGKIAIIELGAGTAVPTVRFQCEQIARRFNADLIRINPREAKGNDVVSIESGALAALLEIAALIA